MRVVRIALCLALAGSALLARAERDAVEAARQRWLASPHGPMLERILPPGFEPAMLPEPESAGARLALRYCVQCHNLPNPAMHHAQKWKGIVARMVLRMRGRGNLGHLMHDMMAGVEAPPESEARALLAYFERHSQRALDPRRVPTLYQAEGQSFRLACNQCHILPDPRRYTAREWPAVTARMQRNMAWMNRVVGTRDTPGEPQLRIEEINAFLAKYARPE